MGYCVQQAANELSLTIPDRLSLVCFDYPATFYNPNTLLITHIKQNERIIAEKCLTLLENIFLNHNFYEKVLVQEYPL